jgi:carbamoylphosphate synthase small subunit
MYQVWSNPLKDVDSRVVTRMLRKEGRTDGSVTISLRNFVGEGIIKGHNSRKKFNPSLFGDNQACQIKRPYNLNFRQICDHMCDMNV